MDIYSSSALYRLFLKEHPTETKDELEKKFVEKEWTTEQVYKFINNYRNITYTEENIKKYIDLVSFFQYDVENDFANYILHTYIIKKQFLDRIYGYGCIINAVCELCEKDEYKILDDDILIYFSNYVEIDKLDASENNKITDGGIKYMQLHTLHASGSQITDEGIKHMQLHTLDVSPYMTDEGIKHMQLHTLNAYDSKITDEGIKHMLLHTLYPSKHMTDKGIKHMHFHTLIASESQITDEVIKHMQLHTLDAWRSKITDEGIKHMQLHTLYAPGSQITDEGIKHMQLHTLYASKHMTDEGIKHMHLYTLYPGFGEITYNIQNGIRQNK